MYEVILYSIGIVSNIFQLSNIYILQFLTFYLTSTIFWNGKHRYVWETFAYAYKIYHRITQNYV